FAVRLIFFLLVGSGFILTAVALIGLGVVGSLTCGTRLLGPKKADTNQPDSHERCAKCECLHVLILSLRFSERRRKLQVVSEGLRSYRGPPTWTSMLIPSPC